MIIISLFCGCVTKEGVFENYYGKCSDYYDVNGVLHKKCDNKIIDLQEFTK